MKKTICFAISIMLLISFAACGVKSLPISISFLDDEPIYAGETVTVRAVFENNKPILEDLWLDTNNPIGSVSGPVIEGDEVRFYISDLNTGVADLAMKSSTGETLSNTLSLNVLGYKDFEDIGDPIVVNDLD